MKGCAYSEGTPCIHLHTVPTRCICMYIIYMLTCIQIIFRCACIRHTYIHSYIHTFIQLKDIKEFASILGDDAEGVRDITLLLALADGYGTYIHTYIHITSLSLWVSVIAFVCVSLRNLFSRSAAIVVTYMYVCICVSV